MIASHLQLSDHLQVLPPGPEKSQGQRVVIGDTAGVLQGCHFKNGQFCQIFKSVPSSRRISAVVTGRGQSQRDKVFIAEGSVVRHGTPFAEPRAPGRQHSRVGNIEAQSARV